MPSERSAVYSTPAPGFPLLAVTLAADNSVANVEAVESVAQGEAVIAAWRERFGAMAASGSTDTVVGVVCACEA